MCWRHSPMLFDEHRVLADVHGPLRARLLRQIGARLREDVPILQVRVQRRKGGEEGGGRVGRGRRKAGAEEDGKRGGREQTRTGAKEPICQALFVCSCTT
jgi:hypothetical protein